MECKWGLVRREDVDDLLQVLKWSKEFGVDTTDGRQVKQGVVGFFAGSTFDPKENVLLRDGTKISLPEYAGRMNIRLLKAADLNAQLRERGCESKITVQRICKAARNEDEVREILDRVWEDKDKSEGFLTEALQKNKDLYEFERMLDQKT